MRMLSVVGMKTSKNHRTTIVSESGSLKSRSLSFIIKFSRTIIVIGLSSFLVFMQVKENDYVVSAREKITAFFIPLAHVVAMPFNWMSSFGDYFRSKAEILAHNERLRLQNEQLIRNYHIHEQIASENMQLRDALNVQIGLVDDITTIRISHHIYDGFSTTFYSPTSSLGDLRKNDPILTTKGYLVGRVTAVSGNYTQIMPISDPTSRVPVKFEKSTQQAVVAGDGNSELLLIHIENPSSVQVGDRLVTSGVGGLFPEGLPVAVVKSVGNKIKCHPFGAIKDQDFVLGLSQSHIE